MADTLAVLESYTCIRCHAKCESAIQSMVTSGEHPPKDEAKGPGVVWARGVNDPSNAKQYNPFASFQRQCMEDASIWEAHHLGRVKLEFVKTINLDTLPAEISEKILNKCIDVWEADRLLKLNISNAQLDEVMQKYLKKVSKSALRQMLIPTTALGEVNIDRLSMPVLTELIDLCARAGVVLFEPKRGQSTTTFQNLAYIMIESPRLRPKYSALLKEAISQYREQGDEPSDLRVIFRFINGETKLHDKFDELCKEASEYYSEGFTVAISDNYHAHIDYVAALLFVIEQCQLDEDKKKRVLKELCYRPTSIEQRELEEIAPLSDREARQFAYQKFPNKRMAVQGLESASSPPAEGKPTWDDLIEQTAIATAVHAGHGLLL